MAVTAVREPPGWLAGGRYRLDGRIATGGMGEVWRATDLVLGRPVAVKLLRPGSAGGEEDLARFRAEARHAGALSHPGIAQVYDYCEADPPCLVMELVDGPCLARLLEGGPLDPAWTMGLIAQAARALAAAHAAGLVHRDIKPQNVLIDRDGQVKVTDFGIASAAGSAPLTRPGALIGTPAYLAPERAAGAPATPAADLYALGIVAYQCLTGRLPFEGEPLAVALAHARQPLPPLPPWVPGEVAALVADLTAKDPRARPASAGQVSSRAEQLRAALTATAVGPRGAQDRRLPARHPARAVLALAAIAAVAAIAAAGWVMAGAHRPAAPHPQPRPSSATRQPGPHRDHPAHRAAPARAPGTTSPAHAPGNGRRPASTRKRPATGPATTPTRTPTGTPTPTRSSPPTGTGTPKPTESSPPTGTSPPTPPESSPPAGTGTPTPSESSPPTGSGTMMPSASPSPASGSRTAGRT
jgi:eukaryotic-like serine/threonine-protein kinase